MSYLSQMAGPDGAELPLRRHRHRARPRRLPRLRGRRREGARQFLGRPRARSRSTCCCRWRRARPGCFVGDGRAADALALCRGDDARRRDPDHPARPGRLPGRDQASRHQWRRLLRRQLGASLRGPVALATALQIWCAAGDPLRSGADLRAYRARHPAGPGAAGRDAGCSCSPARRRSTRPRPAAIRCTSPPGVDPAHGQHGGQGGPLRPGAASRSVHARRRPAPPTAR